MIILLHNIAGGQLFIFVIDKAVNVTVFGRNVQRILTRTARTRIFATFRKSQAPTHRATEMAGKAVAGFR